MSFDFGKYCELLDNYVSIGQFKADKTVIYEFAFALVYMEDNGITDEARKVVYKSCLDFVRFKKAVETDTPYLDLIEARYGKEDVGIIHPKSDRVGLKVTLYIFVNLILLVSLGLFHRFNLYSLSILIALFACFDISGLLLNLMDLCLPALREAIRKRFELMLFTYHKSPWYRSREEWIDTVVVESLGKLNLSEDDRVYYDNLVAASKQNKGMSWLTAMAKLEVLWIKNRITA